MDKKTLMYAGLGLAAFFGIRYLMNRDKNGNGGASEESSDFRGRFGKGCVACGQGQRAGTVIATGNTYNCTQADGTVSGSFTPQWTTDPDGFGYYDWTGYDDFVAGCEGTGGTIQQSGMPAQATWADAPASPTGRIGRRRRRRRANPMFM